MTLTGESLCQVHGQQTACGLITIITVFPAFYLSIALLSTLGPLVICILSALLPDQDPHPFNPIMDVESQTEGYRDNSDVDEKRPRRKQSKVKRPASALIKNLSRHKVKR